VLVVASIFRNSEGYVHRYFEQIRALRDQMPVRLVIAEGDSDDDTLTLLERGVADRDTLLKVDHGGPVYGSIDVKERWAQIAYVCNTVLKHLDLKDSDKLIYVESDLVWPWDTMVQLAKDLDVVGAAAAMSFHGRTGKFYDTWGHVGLDGVPFRHDAPYHDRLAKIPPGRLLPIQSAGSCIAVRGDIVNAGVQFSNDDCIRGFCRSIRDHTPLWLDTGAEVYHP
jgi:hypothetical protein